METETLWAVLAGAVVGAVAGRAFRHRIRRVTERVGRRRVLLIVVLIFLTGLFYSVVHEFGHAVVARLLGGEVRSVSWTVFSGDTPHVTYGRISQGAHAWSSAGGLLVPIGLGLLLAAAWMVLEPHLPWTASACLLVPAVTLLALHLACVVPALGGGGHMRGLASYYGQGELGGFALQLVPVAVSAAGLLAVRRRWTRRHRDLETRV